MSSRLYAFGLFVSRHRLRVLTLWFFLVVVTLAVAGVTGGKLVDDFTIPGTESQRGIDTLAQRFAQASGTTGQIVFTSTSGSVNTHRDTIEKLVAAVSEVPHVSSVDDPFAAGAVGTLSPNGHHALVQVQFDVSVTALPSAVVGAVERAAAPPRGSGLTVDLGGAMYTSTGVGLSTTELVGVAVALLVLVITFSSLLAAGLPLLTAGVGVAVTLAAVLIVAAFTTVSSTTPTLALMIGLAVGMDYALFIVSRHRRQLASGLAVAESIGQALATAGSAVVFAGATVVIALCGLAVARIPFLTVMGVAAAVGVTVAVLVALTLLPALLAACGERLRPKTSARASRVLRATVASRGTMGARWVALVTRLPAVTVVVVVAAIAVLAYPVKDLTLALPDNGSAAGGSAQRTTYDLIAREFGPGFNAPLLVTADIITSTDPRGVVDQIADQIGSMSGVAAVTKQTPNAGGDLGLVRVVPHWAQSDPRTADLVHRIRQREPDLQDRLGVHDLLVTGQTAVAIDVSSRLGSALVPFGMVIVGLSLILLAIVFRSIPVPVKATAGYLLSLAAALGSVSATFVWGWFDDLLNIPATGPVVSFMPIIVMGVLFGLAMDYEVFLVSQIREDYVRHGDARHAVHTGFTSTARVVTAAAIIMVAVFAAFVPHGNATIKPIALALAVGVTVDAFAVRMTLVPAALALLGRRAWWIPRWLDQLLPAVDVEGHAMVRRAQHLAWEQRNGAVAVRAEGLVLPAASGPGTVDLHIAPGSCAIVDHPDPLARFLLTWALVGRHHPLSRQLVVLGHVLPEDGAPVRARARVVTAPDSRDDCLTVRRHLSRVLLINSSRLWPSRRSTRRALQQAADWLVSTGMSSSLDDPLGRRRLDRLSHLDRRLVALAGVIAPHPELVVVEEADAELGSAEVAALAAVCDQLARTRRVTVILVGTQVQALLDLARTPVDDADMLSEGAIR